MRREYRAWDLGRGVRGKYFRHHEDEARLLPLKHGKPTGMWLVTVRDAKTRLSELLKRVLAEEDVVIVKAGKPLARLVPYAPARRKIAPPGGMEGEAWIADDFDAPVDELFDCLKDDAV